MRQHKFCPDKQQYNNIKPFPVYIFAIDHLHASENILIAFLIAVTSRLDAVDAHKNVLQPTRIQ